ncbi:hypothetical protein [Moraxella lacunata]|uniref:hypothetical protein n=1 Tax=Moraxella lacunata TaxID=477 RepID=UPI003EDEA2B4
MNHALPPPQKPPSLANYLTSYLAPYLPLLQLTTYHHLSDKLVKQGQTKCLIRPVSNLCKHLLIFDHALTFYHALTFS